MLKVELWDYDHILRDDFIGETEIDIEGRYFDEKFMSTENYPVETRILRKPESSIATGSIRLWIEIVIVDRQATDAALNQSQLSMKSLSQSGSRGDYDIVSHNRRKWDIQMMPPGGFELRVIIWEVNDCPIDDPEGLTDIYVTCSLPGLQSKSLRTDTHIRSEGFGSFNWRMIFPIESRPHFDKNMFRLEFQIWDKDILSKNDFIANRTFDVWPAINACIATGTKATLKYKSDEKLVLECPTRHQIQNSKLPAVTVTIECLTGDE